MQISYVMVSNAHVRQLTCPFKQGTNSCTHRGNKLVIYTDKCFKAKLMFVCLFVFVFVFFICSSQVQTKYNEVRVASLRPTATAQELFGSRTHGRTQGKDTSNETTHAGTAKLGRDKTVAKELKRFKEKIDSRL